MHMSYNYIWQQAWIPINFIPPGTFAEHCMHKSSDCIASYNATFFESK